MTANRTICVAVATFVAVAGVPVAAQTSPFHYTAAQCTGCAAWSVPEAPRRVFGNTYYVGTHGLSAILITSDRGHILIDGTIPDMADTVIAHIRALGFRVEDVKLILNSHAHFDHAGGIAAVQRASGAEVAATKWSAEVLRKGASMPGDPQYGMVLPFPPVANVQVIGDGQVMRVGPLALTAHVTAGHTPGGTSWSWQSCEGVRCLDLVYADSQSPISANGFLFTKSRAYPTAVHDFQHAAATIEQLPCDILMTPHPEASQLLDRLAANGHGAPPLVDTAGCSRYAATAREAFAKRLDSERGKSAKSGLPQ